MLDSEPDSPGARFAGIPHHLIQNELRDNDITGSTPPAKDGRPNDFGDALDWLTAKMGRERGNLPVNPNANDGGVDVVAWRRFSDTADGTAVLLGQCTVSRRQFDAKLADVRERVWAVYLSLGSPPMTAMVVPYIVDREPPERWALWHYAVGMVIDRPRIVELLCRLDPDDIDHADHIRAWTQERREELAA